MQIARLAELQLSDDQLEHEFDMMDRNGNGSIDMQEVDYYLGKIAAERSATWATLTKSQGAGKANDEGYDDKTARARLSTEPPGTESLARIGVLLTGGEAVQTETPRETPLPTERPGRLGKAAWRRPPLPREGGRA